MWDRALCSPAPSLRADTTLGSLFNAILAGDSRFFACNMISIKGRRDFLGQMKLNSYMHGIFSFAN